MKTIELSHLNESVIHEVMPNGLEVFLLPNKNVKNFYITFNTKYGSLINSFKKSSNKKYCNIPSGVAHFLEHLTFYMDGIDASDYFASIGSSSNAYTSFKVTCYEVFGFNHFKENLEYLINFVQTPYYNEKQVDEEKGIISEEVKMYEDMPESIALFRLLENMFHTSNIKSRITGCVEDVESITLDDILAAYNTFYHPSNMFIVITGNFNPEEALSIISENQTKKEFPKKFKIDNNYEHEKNTIVKETETIEVNVEMEKVSMGIKIPISSLEKLKIKKELTNIYLSLIVDSMFGRSSELKERLVSGNIITDGIYTDIISSEEHVVIHFISETPYPERYISILKESIKNIKLTDDDLIRKIKVAKSNLIMSLDDIEVTNSNIQDDIIEYDKVIPNYYDLYDELNVTEANKICKIISSSPISTLLLTKKTEEIEEN